MKSISSHRLLTLLWTFFVFFIVLGPMSVSRNDLCTYGPVLDPDNNLPPNGTDKYGHLISSVDNNEFYFWSSLNQVKKKQIIAVESMPVHKKAYELKYFLEF